MCGVMQSPEIIPSGSTTKAHGVRYADWVARLWDETGSRWSHRVRSEDDASIRKAPLDLSGEFARTCEADN